MRQADAILARLKLEGATEIGSVDDLIAWLFEDKERLERLAKRDVAYIAERTRLPPRLVHALIHSRAFVQAIFDELHFRFLTPGTLGEIYERIIEQLKDPEVPLGAKRSMLEFMVRQMGLEKPRKLSIKQQGEVVVRVENTRPMEVLEVLGVPLDQIPGLEGGQKALSGPANDALGELGAVLEAEHVPADE